MDALPSSRADALALDTADPLARLRDRFELPAGIIYLDGNSLGALPKATAPKLEDLVRREWGRDLITSWNKAGWIEAPARIGGKIARLVGAAPHEVAVADSTSVNLYKLAAGALSLRPGRRKIVTERGNFHTDVYILEGLAALTGAKLEVLAPEEVLGAIDETTALVALTHVHYATARMWDMPAVTAAAHAKGALMLWDLSHTAGALACDLRAAGADLAVGCGYKHLNGGPGAPAFLFVAERHQGAIRSPLTGWMGHAEPFAFEPSFRPAPGIEAQLCGTPPILGMAALECGVDGLLEADRVQAQTKGRALCQMFIDLVESRCAGHDLTLLGPRDMAQRGLHVSFAHPEGYAVVQALIARGVIGDFRAPDIARFGFPPLYVSYADVWDAVEILRQVLDERAWDRPEFQARAAVT
jgi:kynureninase